MTTREWVPSAIRRAALALRLVHGGGGRAPILDVAAFASRVTRLRVLEDDLPLAIGAVLIDRLGTRRVPPTIVVNLRWPRAQRNLAVAHELGHWVLHAGAAPTAAGRTARRRLEWEADRFALELLLPWPPGLPTTWAGGESNTRLAARLGVPRATLEARRRGRPPNAQGRR